ncbi:DUF3577 domain-containing protein [Pseudomonas aeruginosa]|uniref:DUF3577 domain-containing protein n=1 Tax=Pseudomonas aeruginosa TaxID=287 RepID=UPI000A711365|nr:DUF3577 domain-containing protein [Pseudomonas aeruginosa]
MSNNTQAQEAKYFDLHTTGIGYLNRIREVPIRRGEPFLAATVAALHGAADSVEYSYIDCKVVGAQAEKLVRRCKEAVEAEKKVRKRLANTPPRFFQLAAWCPPVFGGHHFKPLAEDLPCQANAAPIPNLSRPRSSRSVPSPAPRLPAWP